jgi:hypothetical protein
MRGAAEKGYLDEPNVTNGQRLGCLLEYRRAGLFKQRPPRSHQTRHLLDDTSCRHWQRPRSRKWTVPNEPAMTPSWGRPGRRPSAFHVAYASGVVPELAITYPLRSADQAST